MVGNKQVFLKNIYSIYKAFPHFDIINVKVRNKIVYKEVSSFQESLKV